MEEKKIIITVDNNFLVATEIDKNGNHFVYVAEPIKIKPERNKGG